MHFDIAPHHERNGNEAAPGADQCRDNSDAGTGAKHSCHSRKSSFGFRFGVDEHLDSGKADKTDEDERNPEGWEKAGDFGPKEGTYQDTGCNRCNNVPKHCTALVMRSHRRKRREHDGSQRCRDGCMNDGCIRHVGIDQKHGHERREYHAPADTEESGQKTGTGA